MLKARIVSTGLYLPPKIQTASELAPLIGRSEKWILSRTGVAERRIAEEPMEVMAAKAARQALDDGPEPDLILNASLTPLQLIPDSAPFIQEALGMDGIPCWSVHATCLSFICALHSAAAFIEAGVYQRILIVSSEAATSYRNLKEAESAALFGDGAAAVVVERTPPGESSALLGWEMGTWPEGAAFTEFRGGGTRRPPLGAETQPEDYLFHMEGPKVYRMARDRVREILNRLLQRTGLTPGDIDLVVPHQASGRAVAMAAEYGFGPEKTVNTISKYGNTVAASSPMALATAHQEGRMKQGDLLLLGGTGAGLSVAFSLLRW